MGANEEHIERRKGKLVGGKGRGGSKWGLPMFPRAPVLAQRREANGKA